MYNGASSAARRRDTEAKASGDKLHYLLFCTALPGQANSIPCICVLPASVPPVHLAGWHPLCSSSMGCPGLFLAAGTDSDPVLPAELRNLKNTYPSENFHRTAPGFPLCPEPRSFSLPWWPDCTGRTVSFEVFPEHGSSVRLQAQTIALPDADNLLLDCFCMAVEPALSLKGHRCLFMTG